MKIGVVGVGRLGICFALLLNRAGHEVWASDIRSNYISALDRRQITTNEPQVAEMLKESSIKFTSDTRQVIQSSDVIYVMVATPSLADGRYDISAVERIVSDVGECDFDISGRVLVIGCTTNPGDCASFQDQLRSRGVRVLYNPEFIAQGSIIRDLQTADLVLIGGEDPMVIEQYQRVYDDIQTQPPKIYSMSLTAAEIVKIGINCFLTTKISYANMIGEVLTQSGLESDIEPALSAIGSDSRIGHRYMKYGFGYGGPCLPRDNRAFAHYADRIGVGFSLGHVVDKFNQQHTAFLENHFVNANKQAWPFYMGSITYKPNTDILEESQQFVLCQRLLARGFVVYIEPSDILPASVMQDLQNRFADKVCFESRDSLVRRQQKFFEIIT
jgi:UDPglucose 6-dehydrogenase